MNDTVIVNPDDRGVAVYCASSCRLAPEYYDLARAVGAAIARHGKPVITGGGSMGMMGAVIDGALGAGGVNIGVLPQFMLDRKWHHDKLHRVVATDTMAERKLTMARMSCAAIALPGGVGTLDELFDLITQRQLLLYKGNVVICNAFGFYDRLIEHLAYTSALGFMRKGAPEQLWRVAYTAEEAVALALDNAPEVDDPGNF